MIDPGQLQMQNPPVLGIGGEQIAENNKAAHEGNAAIIEAEAIGALAAAQACEANPYGPGCAPGITITGGGMLVLIASCVIIAMGLFGWVSVGTLPS